MCSSDLRDLYGGHVTRYFGRNNSLVLEELTDAVLLNHLEGKDRIGMYFDAGDGTVRLGVIDFDRKEDPASLKPIVKKAVETLESLGFQCAVFASKSKGYHVAVFFSDPVAAWAVRKVLRYVATQSGEEKAELFPKQDKVDVYLPPPGSTEKAKVGSYINLPFHGADLPNGRTAIVDVGNGLDPPPDQLAAAEGIKKNSMETLNAALARIEEKASSPAKAKEPGDRLPADKLSQVFSRCRELNRIHRLITESGHLLHEERIAYANLLSAFEGGRKMVHDAFSHLSDYDKGTTDYQLDSLRGKPPLCSTVCPKGKCKAIRTGNSPVVFAMGGKDAPEEEIEVYSEAERPPLFSTASVERILAKEGFLREYVDYFSTMTDAPTIYHVMMGYATLAAVVGNRVYFSLAGDRLYPNVWVVIIGKSSLFRKTTALNKSKQIVSRIEPKLIYPSDFSTEALIDTLAANPQGIFYHGEFRSLYGMLSKDYMSGAKALLTELYDSPPDYRRELRGKGSIVISDPCINLASATTTEWLTGKGTEQDFGSGFLARFLFVPAFVRERSLPLPPPPDVEKINALVKKAKAIRDRFPFPVEAKYAPGISKAYEEWHVGYDKVDPFGDTPLAPFHGRYQAYAHKLSMLYTLSTGGDVGSMGLNALLHGTDTVEYITRSLAQLYHKHLAFGRDDERMKRILNLIPDKKAITRRDLLQKSKLTKRDFDAVMETLVEIGVVKPQRVLHRGQKATVYAK